LNWHCRAVGFFPPETSIVGLTHASEPLCAIVGVFSPSQFGEKPSVPALSARTPQICRYKLKFAQDKTRVQSFGVRPPVKNLVWLFDLNLARSWVWFDVDLFNDLG
jgi:hypothetical protein